MSHTQDEIIFERDANNKFLDDFDGTYDFYRTMLRYNREERGIIKKKMEGLEARADAKKWQGQ